MTLAYELHPAGKADRSWVDELRRVVYRDLMVATFGSWDEDRHQRYCQECWERGFIRIVSLGGVRVGMLQVIELADRIELSEIQIHPEWQGRRIGQALMIDLIERARAAGKDLFLEVALENHRARRFYQRLGLKVVGDNATHTEMLLGMGDGM